MRYHTLEAGHEALESRVRPALPKDPVAGREPLRLEIPQIQSPYSQERLSAKGRQLRKIMTNHPYQNKTEYLLLVVRLKGGL